MFSENHLCSSDHLQEFCDDGAGRSINKVEIRDVAPLLWTWLLCGIKFVQCDLQLAFEQVKLGPCILLHLFQPCVQNVIPEAIRPPGRWPP